MRLILSARPDSTKSRLKLRAKRSRESRAPSNCVMAKKQVKPLLYQPPPGGICGRRLGAALAIHAHSGRIVSKERGRCGGASSQPPQVIEATLAPPEATPPPEDIPLPEPPPPPDMQAGVHEERTPPPRPPPNAHKIRADQGCRAMSMSRAKALAISAPRPAYPYEARSQQDHGQRSLRREVDRAAAASPTLCGAKYWQSILDNAAISAFRRWRFRPGRFQSQDSHYLHDDRRFVLRFYQYEHDSLRQFRINKRASRSFR